MPSPNMESCKHRNMDAFRIDGKKAVVTGGGSGLGLAIAKVFTKAGADVTIIGRNEEKLKAARQETGLNGASRKGIGFAVRHSRVRHRQPA